MLTIPSWDEDELRGFSEDAMDGLLTLAERWAGTTGDDRPLHQLGGWPDLVQGPFLEECQLASNGVYAGTGQSSAIRILAALRSGAHEWRLFLQLGSDRDLGWMWGDEGLLYFAMREDDIRGGRFDRSWLVLQCA